MNPTPQSLALDRSQWQRVRFGDAIESVTERVDNPAEAGVDRYVGLEHLDPGVMTLQRWDAPEKVKAQKLRFHPGDVIFGRRRAYQKKVALAEFEGICSAHALVLRARPDRILPDFLPVFLSSDYFLDRAVGISVGSLSPTVNWRDLRAQEFELPPLDQQGRIADLLWAVESHRRSLERQRVITAGTSWNDPNSIRLALLNHMLSARNETWSSASLSEIGSITRGRRFTKRDYVDSGIGSIHYAEIHTQYDYVAREAVNFVPDELGPSLRFAQTGDLVIAGTSETAEDVCKAVAWLGSDAVAVHDDCFIFRHNLDPCFASLLFASPDFQRRKAQFVSESKVVRVYASGLKQITVPIPPRATQERIVAAVGDVDRVIERIRGEESRLKDLQTSLIGELLT